MLTEFNQKAVRPQTLYDRVCDREERDFDEASDGKKCRSVSAGQRHAPAVNRESGRVGGSFARVTACNATDSLGTIELFCSYSSGITSIECHCSRVIDSSSLSGPFATPKLLTLNYATENVSSRPCISTAIVVEKTRVSLFNRKFVVVESNEEPEVSVHPGGTDPVTFLQRSATIKSFGERTLNR